MANLVKKCITEIYDDGSVKMYEELVNDLDIDFVPNNVRVSYDMMNTPKSIVQVMAVVSKAHSIFLDIMDHDYGCDGLNFDDDGRCTIDEECLSKEIIFKCITRAINGVAKDMNVSNSTVHTKITRYLGITMDEFRDYFKEYLIKISNKEMDGIKLVDLMMNTVNNNKNEAAVIAGQQFINDYIAYECGMAD